MGWELNAGSIAGTCWEGREEGEKEGGRGRREEKGGACTCMRARVYVCACVCARACVRD